MASDLALAAKAVRAGIKDAVSDGTLPPHPDGITFRVRSRRASLMSEVDIDVLGVPGSWMYDDRPGAINRPSPAWRLLREALTRIAAGHFDANGSTSFIDVQADPETERHA